MRPGDEGPTPGGASLPLDPEAEAQTLSDRDQTSADTDQTGSDLDQTAADADQLASHRDQVAADRDQDAADEDQAVGGGDQDEAYARSRRARSKGSTERDMASHARSQSARMRAKSGARRDRMADERDAAARARDELAASLDEEIERLDLECRREDGPRVGMDVLLRAASDRKRTAAIRSHAAMQREAAARDREQAAQDRRQAALDRAAAAEELALEGLDHLTGALRRRVGLAAIQREMDRARRTDERLVMAFVDVDGLKRVNDLHGHGAGDELLRVVAGSILQHLRSYDVITRFGGDEFVCLLSGQDAPRAHERFKRISGYLADAAHGATFTVGLAEPRDEDSLEELIRRADAAMINARRRSRA